MVLLACIAARLRLWQKPVRMIRSQRVGLRLGASIEEVPCTHMFLKKCVDIWGNDDCEFDMGNSQEGQNCSTHFHDCIFVVEDEDCMCECRPTDEAFGGGPLTTFLAIGIASAACLAGACVCVCQCCPRCVAACGCGDLARKGFILLPNAEISRASLATNPKASIGAYTDTKPV